MKKNKRAHLFSGCSCVFPIFAALCVWLLSGQNAYGAEYVSAKSDSYAGRVEYFEDDGTFENELGENHLTVNGEEVFCLDPHTAVQVGAVTRMSLSEYGMPQETVTRVALTLKYLDESGLSGNALYMMKQLAVWRTMNDVYGFNLGNTRLTAQTLDYDTQNRVLGSVTAQVEANLWRYKGDGYAYVNDGQAVGNFTLRQVTGFANLNKASAMPELTDGNACYDLSGAIYGVYADAQMEQLVDQMITDENGDTETIELKEGTYYVYEDHAPEGFLPDDEIHEIRVTAGQTETVTCTDFPAYDMDGLRIRKINTDTGGSAPSGKTHLAGAQFTICYYDGYYGSGELPAEPTRTWILAAKEEIQEEGEVKYVCDLAEGYQVGGDPLYYKGEVPVLPLGTVAVWESVAPDHYILDDSVWSSSGGTCGRILVRQILGDGNGGHLTEGNEAICLNRVLRGDFRMVKIDAKTQKAMSGIRFRITSVTTNESHEFETDANGGYSSAEDPEMWFGSTEANEWDRVTGSEEGRGFYAAKTQYGALPYDEYIIEELECDGNKGKVLWSGKLYITDEGRVVSLGTIENEDQPVPAKNEVKKAGKSAGTGDTSSAFLYVIMCAGALLLLCALACYNEWRRYRRERKHETDR